MTFRANRRVYERWPVQLPAELVTAGGAAKGQLHDLSLGGAYVETATVFPVGTGLKLSFRLHNGMPVYATGRVVRIGQRSPGVPGLGIEFYGLDDVTREILRNSLGGSDASHDAPDATVQMEEKFRVSSDRAERVYLLLAGFLDREECRSLAHMMSEALASLSGGGVRLCINASRFQCCTPESVEQFKHCFSLLARRPWLAGALVGPRTVGMMQLRRAARDANVADSFASFDDVGEALELLEMVQH